MAEYLVEDGRGLGGFLDPPGYPTHRWVVYEGRRENPRGISSVQYIARDPRAQHASADIKAQCEKLIQDWFNNRPALASPEVQQWIADCLRYWGDREGAAHVQAFYPEAVITVEVNHDR